MITRKNRPKKFELTRGQNLLESLKNYAKLKEYKFTLQWVTPKVHLLNVQYHPWKKNFTVTWKIMDRSTFTTCLTLSQLRFPEKFNPWTWYQRMSRIPIFCPFSTASHYKNIENPSLKWDTEFAYQGLTLPSGRVISHNVQREFLKLLQFLLENLEHIH